MTAIQRFGSALNLNVHFHTLAVQGVFVDDGAGGLRFVPNPEPSDLDVAKLLTSVSRRITRLVRRHGIDLENPSEEVDRLDPLASESPLLAGICGASVVGRIANHSPHVRGPEPDSPENILANKLTALVDHKGVGPTSDSRSSDRQIVSFGRFSPGPLRKKSSPTGDELFRHQRAHQTVHAACGVTRAWSGVSS